MKVNLETFFALRHMPIDQARRMISDHLPEYLLFGSDFPWEDQSESILHLKSLELGKGLEQRILGLNAGKLLGFDVDSTALSTSIASL